MLHLSRLCLLFMLLSCLKQYWLNILHNSLSNPASLTNLRREEINNYNSRFVTKAKLNLKSRTWLC